LTLRNFANNREACRIFGSFATETGCGSGRDPNALGGLTSCSACAH